MESGRRLKAAVAAMKAKELPSGGVMVTTWHPSGIFVGPMRTAFVSVGTRVGTTK